MVLSVYQNWIFIKNNSMKHARAKLSIEILLWAILNSILQVSMHIFLHHGGKAKSGIRDLQIMLLRRPSGSPDMGH
jgi:hypothetical protein